MTLLSVIIKNVRKLSICYQKKYVENYIFFKPFKFRTFTDFFFFVDRTFSPSKENFLYISKTNGENDLYKLNNNVLNDSLSFYEKPNIIYNLKFLL